MSTALRPILRPTKAPSLPISSLTSATYICNTCRHAQLLRRPKRPYTFTQLVTLSDGSAFTMRTTSPVPVYRSTRDTRNAPLWNPSSKDLLNVEDDEAGRLAGFRARFGVGFDANKEPGSETQPTPSASEGSPSATPSAKTSPEDQEKAAVAQQKEQVDEDDEDDLDSFFASEDANLLNIISSYGKDDKGKSSQISKKGMR